MSSPTPSPAPSSTISLPLSAPQHPVPSMRGPFAESILDSTSPSPKMQCKYHPLEKTTAQLAFGLYLLHAGLAKSTSSVLRILQGHVSDVDAFVSHTASAFTFFADDIATRTSHLQMPLEEAPDVFDAMLGSAEFRVEVLGRVENVETVVRRTDMEVARGLKDVKVGLAAVEELAKFLLEIGAGWEERGEELARAHKAVEQNVERWFRMMARLRKKGVKLEAKLDGLRGVVEEVERRVGIASRRAIMTGPRPPRRRTRAVDTNKPLPATPQPTSIPVFTSTLSTLLQAADSSTASSPETHIQEHHRHSRPRSTPLAISAPETHHAPRPASGNHRRHHHRRKTTLALTNRLRGTLHRSTNSLQQQPADVPGALVPPARPATQERIKETQKHKRPAGSGRYLGKKVRMISPEARSRTMPMAHNLKVKTDITVTERNNKKEEGAKRKIGKRISTGLRLGLGTALERRKSRGGIPAQPLPVEDTEERSEGERGLKERTQSCGVM